MNLVKRSDKVKVMFDYFRFRGKVCNGLYKAISKFFYRHFFFSFGKNSKIVAPLALRNTRNISIGERTTVNNGVFMMVENNGVSDDICHLYIGNGVTLGHSNHIVALDSVIIEDNVLTADRVYISDNVHDYDNIELPISHQKVLSKKPTRVGEGSWLGENVCVISANIGKHCVIGANSVVVKDIPDYSVAVGSPAIVIKRFDVNTKKWIKA